MFVGPLGSVKDSKVFRRSSLYNKTQYHGLFNLEKVCQDGILLYLFRDKGYPLLDWILTPCRKGDQEPIQKKTKEGKVGGRKCF
jgi:hypothetical protein